MFSHYRCSSSSFFLACGHIIVGNPGYPLSNVTSYCGTSRRNLSCSGISLSLPEIPSCCTVTELDRACNCAPGKGAVGSCGMSSALFFPRVTESCFNICTVQQVCRVWASSYRGDFLSEALKLLRVTDFYLFIYRKLKNNFLNLKIVFQDKN